MKVVEMVINLIESLVQPQNGTKFVITAFCMGFIYFMHKQAISTDLSDILLASIVVVYYLVDMYAKRNRDECCDCEDCVEPETEEKLNEVD